MNSVAVFSDTIWPLGSGGELATHLYAEFMQDLGIRPVFIVNKAGAYKHLKIMELKRLGKGKYALTLNVKSLIEVLRDTDVAYFASCFLEFIPFVRILMNKPVVVHVHSYYPCCPIGHMYNFHDNTVCGDGRRDCAKCVWKYEVQRRNFSEALLSTMLNATAGRFFLRTLSMADAVIFVSEAQRRLFLEVASKKGLHISSKKTQVIYNPLPDLKPVKMEGDDVGFLGGFDPIKGFKTLYLAWAKIFPKHQSNKLHVAKAYKLPADFESMNIVTYGHLKPPIEVLKVIRKVRVLTVPSLSPEPAPYSAVETCLYGRLLIASKIGGIPEIVGDLLGVKLIPSGDEDELSDALDWALSMGRYEAVELGLKNRENILRRFDKRKSVNELVKVFEKVVG
jgi:glycosyltransferase involved in cell wall biosynthesis